jgi:D-3-phosphoglycerate dehydrogenase
MLVLLADAFLPDLPKRLEAFGEVSQDMSREGEAEVLIVRSKTKVGKDVIDKAPKLKLIIRGGVGVDTIDVPYAESRKIKVTNTPEASSVAVAELAFSMMLSLASRICEADPSMKQGKWLKKELERTELMGKTLGLVGIGRIAREVAVRAKAFGMDVVAFDRFVPKSDAARMVDLEELYAKSDYISLHVPLTDETKGMINASALAKMKKGVRIVNTCRGKVVVEADVAAALKDGRLAGYASDVYYSDPPENSPLVTAPNTILSPHLGASTAENLKRLEDCIVERMKSYTGK